MKKNLLFTTLLFLVLTSCGTASTSSINDVSSNQESNSESATPSASNLSSNSELSSEKISSSSVKEKQSCGFDGTVDGIHFVLPDLGEEVEIHTEMQKTYLASKYYGTVNRYADGLSEESYQEPVKLTWTATTATPVTKYTVALSTKEDMSNSLLFDSTTSETTVDNLMIGTKYYWNVTVNDSIKSGVAKFVTTSVAPRNLRIPGVKNVRDMGGISTVDGKKVKQNRIIRCGAFTLNESGQTLIKKEGIDILNNQFHMKTEIDLRGETASESGKLTGSILGSQVSYRLCGMKYSGSNCLLDNKAILPELFEIFANEANYPICFHCSEGTDRAGMVAFLLNCLWGVDEMNNYRDYLFSAFRDCSGKIPALSNITNSYVKTIKTSEGATIKDQAYNCLVGLGVSKDVLDKVISLNIE